MPTTESNPWRRRVRRLLFFAGTATSFYLLISYSLDRMREARLRALRERREKDLLKNHFTSLLSTISFTLYALLPTLHPQLQAEYPVEATSQALQGLSAPASSVGSVQPTPESSLVLPHQPHSTLDTTPSETSNGSPTKSTTEVGESWASDFRRRESGSEGEDHSMVGSSEVQVEDDTGSSSGSQSISLPPTDRSYSLSPPFERSPLQPHQHSPESPQHSTIALQVPSTHVMTKSKKELWGDLKIQTLSRSLTTAYVVPLLYLLTSSQLATLARIRYLADVKDSLPTPQTRSEAEPQASVPTPAATHRPTKKGWFSGLSIDAMGLRDYVDGTTGGIIPPILNPVTYLPVGIAQYLPSFGLASDSTTPKPEEGDSISRQIREEQLASERAEDERVYLTYSWWILHEGWRGLAARVESAVEEVFGRMPLKRDLTVRDWESSIREIRARIETTVTDGNVQLYSFMPHIFPSDPLPPIAGPDPCPLPPSPPVDRPHLTSLLSETAAHLASPDANFLIEKGVTAMIRRLIESMKEDIYNGSQIGLILDTRLPSAAEERKRLVDCLPGVDRWAKGVWEGLPDHGVEALTCISEFEGFAALIFGDWAPR